MIRKIITIDEEKCNGCGLCAEACHESAIGIVDGKAKLLRDDYCDGLGNCLPVCPTEAISFEEREAAAYDEETVKRNIAAKKLPCGCPGAHVRAIVREVSTAARAVAGGADVLSQLNQWPVQMKLVPVNAPYFQDANLLISADCCAYAHGNFHKTFMRGKITLIGCPKLDQGDCSEKLTEILAGNDVKSVTVLRMEVPCCGGIENAVKTALKNSGKAIPCRVVTLATNGEVL
ncbi:MAG: 4Fe-4S binding protein [Synergistaceae bacterium]|nr:4Fe-4S binding protein [Synergistaceae bacterium]